VREVAPTGARRRKSDLLNEIAVLQEAARASKSSEDAIDLLREANQNLVLATMDAQTMRDDADAINRRQVEFLAMLAHELRNPLAPISNGAQLLAILVGDDPQVLDVSQIITRQVGHMTRLLDDLLDVSRITQGTFRIESERLDLAEIVSDAIEQVRPLIDRKRHQLIVKNSRAEVCVQGDRTRLVQVLGNLLTNAAKYTPKGGKIVLRVDARPDEVYVSVSDNGIGIAPEFLSHMFDLFIQAEKSIARSDGGLGLGLAVVRDLVERHGGTVQARSKGLGKGSMFTIMLPRLIDSAPAIVLEPVIALPPDVPSLRLMVVDDNEDSARTIAMLLTAHGHHATIEYDSLAALTRAATEKPRVMLIDIGLPGMDGYELARRLRALPETRRAVLVALSGYGQQRDRELSEAAGFDYHLVKPLTEAQLMQMLVYVSVLARPDSPPP
jgi:signal transduction histidine kinase/CheY-like chemotaxis protein